MHVSTDTITLYASLTFLEGRHLFNQIIKRYNNTSHVRFRYFIADKRRGIFFWHLPRFPTSKFTTKLMYQGYSHDSPFLKDIFALVPLERWSVKRLDIAFDSSKPYEQFHVVHPAKRADMTLYPTSLYMGSRRSATQLHIYDKQREMWERHGIQTDTWTRTELRFCFAKMKKVAGLTVDDLVAANQYEVIRDIDHTPPVIRQMLKDLNSGKLKWKELTRTKQKKIREYAAAQAINLYDLILSCMMNLPNFLYSPSPQRQAKAE